MEDYRLEQSGQEVQDILNGAAMQTDLTAENDRAELAEQALQGNIDDEASTRENADIELQGHIDDEEIRAKAAEKQNADDIDAIEEKIPSGASSQNKLATAGELAAKQDALTFDNAPTPSSTNPVTSGGVYTAIDNEKGARINADAALQQSIEAILLLIPSAATALNQLADKSFVNSTVATASATFRGTYNLVSDLSLAVTATHAQIAAALAGAVSGADNNDYCFVQIPTSADTPTEIRVTERYKFNGENWAYEYDLNNSGFTAAQWEAINSAITSALVTKLSALPTASELTTLFAGKQNVLTFDNAPVSGSSNPVKSGGIYDAIAAITAVIPSTATSSNKLVDLNALTTYVTGIIGALDASFDLTSTDGHVTLKMTQVDGVITTLQILTSDIASAQALTTLSGQVSTNADDIAALQALYNALQQSAPQVIEPADTWPVASPSDTVIYRVIDRVNTPPQYYSDYMWNGTTMVLMATYNNAIDPLPKKDSQNLVTSGGVFNNMGALDVSELNATENPHHLAQYVDLSAALAAVPTDYQKGGMSIKFVQSSDNKYVQYRLMSDTFNTTPSNWQGVDDEPTVGSKNLVESGGVYNKFTELDTKCKNLNKCKEDGVFVTDENGNIGAIIDKDGNLDAIGLGNNLKKKVGECTNSTKTKENGVFVIDDNNNVAALIDEEGNLDALDFGDNLKRKIGDNNLTSLISRANDALSEARAINAKIDDALPSLLYVKTREGVERSITLPSVGIKKKTIVRVGLHYGSSAFTPKNNDIFFDGLSHSNFNDVRFFDGNGKLLKAELGESVNMDFLWDSNLNPTIKYTSEGTLVGYNNGVVLSEDGGDTWSVISGTDTQGTPSAVYNRRYMYPVFVDSSDNIYAYRGGKLYKITKASNYATIREVLDFIWVNSGGTTIYPDIQNHGMDEDRNGVLYCGACYQVDFHTTIYKSTDGGETWTITFASWDGSMSDNYKNHLQHVHHIHADPNSDAVYAGVDDAATTWNGAFIFKTVDGGNTWVDISENSSIQRGKDYYPTYFGNGFMLGGSECYGEGGNAVIRSSDNIKFTYPVKGYAGVRSYGDFGIPNVIVAGTQNNDLCCENQIIVSRDLGKTWKTVVDIDDVPQASSGGGFRDALSCTIKGESEPCIILCNDFANLGAMRIYNGGSHYYRDAYILLENTSDVPIQITAKTGYAMPYPFKNLKGVYDSSLVYEIPLNEGIGKYVKDIDGNTATIETEYKWENKEEPVRYGEYGGNNKEFPATFSSGIHIDGCINFGKIKALNFSENYTIIFWWNPVARTRTRGPRLTRFDTGADDVMRKIMSFGGLDLITRVAGLGVCTRGATSYYTTEKILLANVVATPQYTDSWHMIALVVKNGSIEASINGNLMFTTLVDDTLTTLNDVSLSQADFVIGTETPDACPMDGYVSDVKVYNKALTREDITSIYKGYNV